MRTYRGNAIAVGVLFIACSAAAILSIVPLGGTVGAPVDFAKLAGSENAVVTTALIEFVWAATGMGIAIALYPVLRLFNPALALGSVAGRVVENVFILIGTLSLLALLTVSQQAAGSTAPSSFQATGDALVAVREWTSADFVAGLAFVVGTFMYNYVMYRSRLVPRWLSGWGLVGAVSILAAHLYVGFTQDFGATTVSNLLSAPIGLQEMVLAVWLIAKGFSAPALASVAATGEGAA
jgi:Ca2+/Na+ antiporter